MSSIGQFEVGVSSIGNPSFAWQNTVISQWANSPVLMQLLADMALNIDPSSDLENFYDYVWNVQTAQGFGLDIWGRIVGIGRYLNIAQKFFGFEEAGTVSADPFNQSPFFDGYFDNGTIALSDAAFRTLIIAKGAANICSSSIIAINALLNYVWSGRGGAWCTDGENMTMTYTFNFTLSAVDLSIINTGVLPKPCGVSYTIVQV